MRDEQMRALSDRLAASQARSEAIRARVAEMRRGREAESEEMIQVVWYGVTKECAITEQTTAAQLIEQAAAQFVLTQDFSRRQFVLLRDDGAFLDDTLAVLSQGVRLGDVLTLRPLVVR